jgi:hypothetical protein
MRSVIPAEVTAADQAEVERHIDERIAPLILDIFSFCGHRWLTVTRRNIDGAEGAVDR